MSLIYEALKKLETTRYGYERPLELKPLRAREPARDYGLPVMVGLAFVAAFAASAAVYFFTLFSAGSEASGISPPEKEAATAAAVLPGPSEKPAVSANVLNRTGVDLFRAGAVKEALKRFLEAFEKDPSNGVIANNLGLAYLKLNNLVESERYLNRALDLRPAYPEALNNYGALLQRLGEDERAVELFEKAMMLDASYPDPHLNMAISLERLERYSEALVHYRRFLALGGGDEESVKRKIQGLRSALVSGRGDRGF